MLKGHNSLWVSHHGLLKGIHVGVPFGSCIQAMMAWLETLPLQKGQWVHCHRETTRNLALWSANMSFRCFWRANFPRSDRDIITVATVIISRSDLGKFALQKQRKDMLALHKARFLVVSRWQWTHWPFCNGSVSSHAIIAWIQLPKGTPTCIPFSNPWWETHKLLWPFSIIFFTYEFRVNLECAANKV